MTVNGGGGGEDVGCCRCLQGQPGRLQTMHSWRASGELRRGGRPTDYRWRYPRRANEWWPWHCRRVPARVVESVVGGCKRVRPGDGARLVRWRTSCSRAAAPREEREKDEEDEGDMRWRRAGSPTSSRRRRRPRRVEVGPHPRPPAALQSPTGLAKRQRAPGVLHLAAARALQRDGGV